MCSSVLGPLVENVAHAGDVRSTCSDCECHADVGQRRPVELHLATAERSEFGRWITSSCGRVGLRQGACSPLTTPLVIRKHENGRGSEVCTTANAVAASW